MKKLLVELDYSSNLMCANSKDEQDLIRILSNAKVVKYDYRFNGVLYMTDQSFKMKMIEDTEILPGEPEEEVKEND